MSEKNRRWFQIHLSTAIVMMIVAGLFLYPNFQSHSVYITVSHSTSNTGQTIKRHEPNLEYGWPFRFLVPHAIGSENGFVLGASPLPTRLTVAWLGLLGNCLVLLTIVCAVAFVLEAFIRFREARKT